MTHELPHEVKEVIEALHKEIIDSIERLEPHLMKMGCIKVETAMHFMEMVANFAKNEFYTRLN